MRRIVVVDDLADRFGTALARACRIANDSCSDLHILERAGAIRMGSSARPSIADIRKSYPCIATITTRPCGGSPKSVAATAHNCGADLIVMRNTIDQDTHHDRPFDTIAKMLRHTSLPVLAVQGREIEPYRAVLALIDDDAGIGADTLDLALSIKSAQRIYALHVAAEAGEAETRAAARLRELVDRARRSRTDCSAPVEPMTRVGDVTLELIQAWDLTKADLIVAVTHRRRGLRALFGASYVGELLEDLPFDLLVREARADEA